MKISLILPVYNPSEGWANIVLAKSGELIALYPDIDFETIIINDGSVNEYFADGKKMLESAAVKLIEYSPNKGKGEALRTGVSASTGEIVIYTDIDFPYTIGSIGDIIDIVKDGDADVAIGVKGTHYYDHVPAARRFISRLFRSCIRVLFRIPTDDTQCGLKGFNKKGKEIFLRTTINRYLFDLEFVFLVSREKSVKLETRAVELRDDVRFRKMNFGILRNELWNFLKILLRSYA